MLNLFPIPVKHALRFNAETHRRLPKLQGAMWAVGLSGGEDDLSGVAIVGRPTARRMDSRGRLQVTRCAVREGTRNGCSALYGACAKAARSMGCVDMFTYIHDDETGVSLKAAGWIEETDFISEGGEWSVPSRPRLATVEPGRKRRWWAPWSAYIQAWLERQKRKQAA